MTGSAATLVQAVPEAIQSPRLRTSTQQISMTTKPTLDRIAITRNSGVKTWRGHVLRVAVVLQESA
jgi:hypothetical protein